MIGLKSGDCTSGSVDRNPSCDTGSLVRQKLCPLGPRNAVVHPFSRSLVPYSFQKLITSFFRLAGFFRLVGRVFFRLLLLGCVFGLPIRRCILFSGCLGVFALSAL